MLIRSRIGPRAVLPVLACMLAPQASATDPDDPVFGGQRGIASAWPMGLIVEGTSNWGLRVKQAGDQSTFPARILSYLPSPGSASASNPDYSLFPLLDSSDPTYSISIDDVSYGVLIDAISSGNGIILDDGNVQGGVPQDGRLDVPAAWLGLTVSVESDNTGLGDNYFNDAFAASGNAGGEIVTYLEPGSTALPQVLRGRTVLEMGYDQIGLAGNGAVGGSSQSHNVSAFDFGLGINSTTEITRYDQFFRNHREVYFSVSQQYVDQFDPNNTGRTFATKFHANGSTSAVSPHAADIYRIEWLPGSLEWSHPTVYASAEDLHIDTPQADIDALEVDPVNKTIVFSTTLETTFTGLDPGQEHNQLMIIHMNAGEFEDGKHAGGSATAPMVLKDKNGSKITRKLGVGEGGPTDGTNVTAGCLFDPDAGHINDVAGNPTDTWGTQFTEPMGLSVVRSDDGLDNGLDNLTVHATGWGDVPPNNDSYRVFFWIQEVGGSMPGASGGAGQTSDLLYLGANLRTPGQDTTEVTVKIPSTISDLDMEIHACMYSGATMIARTHNSRIGY